MEDSSFQHDVAARALLETRGGSGQTSWVPGGWAVRGDEKEGISVLPGERGNEPVKQQMLIKCSLEPMWVSGKDTCFVPGVEVMGVTSWEPGLP